MNNKIRYQIPAKTAILWRNVHQDLKLRPHLTESALQFDEMKCTGDGGLILYFELGNWLVVVEAELVQMVTQESGVNEEAPRCQLSAKQARQPFPRLHRFNTSSPEPTHRGTALGQLAYSELPLLQASRA